MSGKEFAVSVEKKVEEETNWLKNKHDLSLVQLATGGSEQPEQSNEAAPSVVLFPDKGSKLVFDNFVHWCRQMADENHVSRNHLSDTKQDADGLLQMENGLCFPSCHDHHL